LETALELEGVRKTFGSHVAVEGLDLRVPKGCIYGWLGPNGAGKTTTIRMVMSIFLPDQGRLSILGSRDPLAVKDRLGYLPEEKGLYKKMRILDVIAYFGTLKGLSGRQAKARALELLETQDDLKGRGHERCEALSKGLEQKVQVLTTLVHEPELVILDEPFSGLDPINRDLLRDVILDMKRSGKTVIFSTHVMEQAEELCDHVFMINRGRKVQDGTLEEVKSSTEEAIQLDYAGDASFVHELPYVERFNDSGKKGEVFLRPGGDPQELLQALASRLTVRRFDLREPSLHEVFVRTVKEDVA
jgi:ABC-2 type transport system ATP-binding protein